MNDELESKAEYNYRYLFTVRQPFGAPPVIDCFYELKVPAGITADQAKVMQRLNEGWCAKEITDDTHALKGMQLRLRFNQDMYQRVCLVRTTEQITDKDLSAIIKLKFESNELKQFLDESALAI